MVREKQNFELLLRVRSNGNLIRTSCDKYCYMANMKRRVRRSGKFDLIICDPVPIRCVPWYVLESEI